MRDKLRRLWEMFFAPSRLRRKFLRAFLMVGLIPLLLVGAFSIYLIARIHHIDTIELERTLARQTAVEISKEIDEALEIISVEVTADAATPLTANQEHFILERLIENANDFQNLFFICVHPHLCNTGYETSRVERIEGGVSTSTHVTSFLENPLFLEPSKGGIYVGPVEFAGGIPTLTVSSPVLGRDRSILAVLAGTLSLSSVQAIIESNQLGETGYVYLLNDRGDIVAHRDYTVIGANVYKLLGFSPAFSNPAFLRGGIYKNFQAIEVNGIAVPVPDLSLSVVAEWPRAETQEVVTTTLWGALAFALGTLVLILIIGGIFTSGLLRPINLIKQGVKEVGQGNFEYRFLLHTKDELEELGERLNGMTQDLKGIQELQELQLRTQLLSENLRKEQELSKLKDQFVQTVSHQFNTPLSVIHWTLEMLGDTNVDPGTVKNGLATIDRSRRDILSMVNNLLTLSEIGLRYTKTNSVPYDFRKIVGASITKVHEDITEKHLVLQFSEEGTDFTADINEFAMSKAVENLIENAVAYSHANGKIEITLRSDARALTFSITDHGIGIPENEHHSIFQQFFRASNAVAKKNVGSGLGLFITKTIIEGHGGTISFESRENAGATFTFSLPHASSR